MKTTACLLLFFLIGFTVTAQEKNFLDQPYIETIAMTDTLVKPDRIYMTIILREADTKNKKSTEELEIAMESKLKELGIDTKKNLSLLDLNSDFKKTFLSGTKILKDKNYMLLVYDAVTAGKVATGLESVGISNVDINRSEYSKAEDLLLELKAIAIKKAYKTAEKMAMPLGQKAGKAVFISDISSTENFLQGKLSGVNIRGNSSAYGSRAEEPIYTEFEKIKFQAKVTVKFRLE